MHSRIFKVNTEYLTEEYKKYIPIEESDYYDNGFLDGYHDYVAELSKEEEYDSYDWLKNCIQNRLKNSSVEINNGENKMSYLTLNKEDIKQYLITEFDSAQEKINNIVDILKENKQDKFTISSGVYNINLNINGDKGGFYFEWCTGYYTETEFFIEMFEYMIRKNIDSVTMRLEGALDYHS